ncbi:ribonuclease H [Trifolium pratense]|uniref:Ribonuclease H n=1 Tax=Trifolium pratense TaxID=57577 RepID=A0A2K3NCX4_TRIPR|nr:ribonuclease H [Trifolium pratense]
MQGCRWMIGDGSQIKVMNEPWLRGCENCWVSAPQNQNMYQLTVQQLMIPNTKRWDANKIHSLFSEAVAQNMLVVPLLEQIHDDKQIWKEERDGIYSVRSGYRKMMREKDLWCRTSNQMAWGLLWKIQAPPKSKHLIWRICKECLPTRTRLQSRYVSCPLECPLCSQEEEKQFVWNDNKLNARQIGSQAVQLWEEWRAVHVFRPAEQQQQQVTPGMQWQTPTQGRLKCNVDASFYDDEGVCGGGWCIRDCSNHFILAVSNFIHERINTIEGETLAIKEAMCEVIQRGFSHVTFESDSKVVVDAIHSRNLGEVCEATSK